MKNSMFVSPLSFEPTKPAYQRPAPQRGGMPQFTAREDPTRGFTPRQVPMNVQGILAAKHLLIHRDPQTGYLRSKDGRKNDPNQQLAEAMSVRYGFLEPMFIRMRQIAANEVAAGLIQYTETGLVRDVLLTQVQSLCQAGIISRYAEYATGIYVQLNAYARNFLSKEFAQLYLVNYIKQTMHPDEIFYDVHLGEGRGGSETYVADVIHRQGSSVKFTIIALNQRLDQMPHQMERLVRITNRLRSSVTIVVSPSIDVQSFAVRLNNMTDSKADIVTVVPFTRLALLP